MEITSKGGFRFQIDDEDFEKFSQYKWSVMPAHGARRMIWSKIKGQFSRFIMGCPKGMVVDHINGDPMDNRKSNLRICSQADNCKNCKIHRNNKSGFKGVRTRENKFFAELNSNYVRYRSYGYDTKEEAAIAYNELAKKYHGEFANLNKL